jgi:hypothetical protein
MEVYGKRGQKPVNGRENLAGGFWDQPVENTQHRVYVRDIVDGIRRKDALPSDQREYLGDFLPNAREREVAEIWQIARFVGFLLGCRR